MHQVVVPKVGYKWTPFFLKSTISKLQQEFEDSYVQKFKIRQKKSSSPLNLLSKLLFFFQNGLVLGPRKRGPQKVVLVFLEKE